MAKKTQTQLLNDRTAKTVAKMRRGAQKTAELMNRVRAGELTAGQALQIKCGKIPDPMHKKEN